MLFGMRSDFPLNARIFHSACIVAIIGLLYNVPFNYAIGLTGISLLSAVVLLIVSGLYYMSRFGGKTDESIFITNFVGIGLFLTTYFINSGIHGPTVLFFLLLLLITIAINPVGQYKIWVPCNILIVIGLYVFEYYNPDYIHYTYSSRTSEFLDHGSAYVVVAVMAFFCMDYIRRNYEGEKESAIRKSKAIEQQNQQIVRQNAELEKLNAQKNKLMSVVAHDLRSPLANIQNYLELLSDIDLNDSQKADIEKDLLNATKETLSMLSKLLVWSKSQSHGVVVKPEYMSLYSLLESTLVLEISAAALKGITLEYHLPSHHFVYADREMMLLVIRNFIGNAIKFTAPGGRITVFSECNEEECVISIRDTGIGISAERQNQLFSLHAKSTYGTNGEKGIGLGLLLCQEYMTAQKGNIWYENIDEGGTCFHISLPVNENASVLQAVE
jgi:two-component system sensor histidine kinase/response regulator